MQSFIKCIAISLCLLGIGEPPTLFAEVKQEKSTVSKTPSKEAAPSQPAKKRLYIKPVPFAHYENALKNSERWKAMSPDEQSEALEKIKQARERFRKRELERQKQYLPILKKSFKRKRMPQDYEEFPEKTEKAESVDESPE